jgi:2-iminobutanoate/2-iminopropanoate deaminase
MTTIITGGADPNEMPFSIAVSTGRNPRTVQVSGATAFPLVHKHPHDEDELRVPAALYDQTVRALHNLRIALDAAGAAVTDIEKVVIYNTRIDQQDEVNRAYLEFFGEHRPARTHVGVNALVGSGLLIEIEATAVVGDGPVETRDRF